MPATAMHAFRRAHLLARLLLACFVLAMLAASGAPLVRAVAMERVCSALGPASWVIAADQADADAAQGTSGHGLECALCLPLMLAPRARGVAPSRPPVAAQTLLPARRQPFAPALSRAPFPPRAPPA